MGLENDFQMAQATGIDTVSSSSVADGLVKCPTSGRKETVDCGTKQSMGGGAMCFIDSKLLRKASVFGKIGKDICCCIGIGWGMGIGIGCRNPGGGGTLTGTEVIGGVAMDCVLMFVTGELIMLGVIGGVIVCRPPWEHRHTPQ